eukprot:CAMPEP_0202910798 /NCGR_PEP_ID=MMETSP1392-20130828/53058_1 /ASSEMBLY_ACC=CAM_ASM_000868 /TAXON_ID=225041 /ORGANISM="Chlamydomonas chlamydogama, Strain SAG 11-48b" /LENGTH=263 /DNA_ID=CAMNT_0049601041 /DNA_START=84 /DNA_END=875 /DNA_ORIENTATION=-
MSKQAAGTYFPPGLEDETGPYAAVEDVNAPLIPKGAAVPAAPAVPAPPLHHAVLGSWQPAPVHAHYPGYAQQPGHQAPAGTPWLPAPVSSSPPVWGIMEDVPEVRGLWRENRVLMVLLPMCSFTVLMLYALLNQTGGVVLFAAQQVSAYLGFIMAVLYWVGYFKTSFPLHRQVKYTLIMSTICCVIDGLSLGAWTIVTLGFMPEAGWCVSPNSDTGKCSGLFAFLLIFAGPVAVHFGMCWALYRRSRTAQMLLNPVSNGLVAV